MDDGRPARPVRRRPSRGGAWPAPLQSAQAVPFAIGDVVRVVDGALNLHAAPGLATAVVAILPDGALLTILDGPTPADGYDWYRVDAPSGPGWCVGAYLQRI